jgi:spore coat protein CotF
MQMKQSQVQTHNEPQSAPLNHGGHEMFDMMEVLGGTVNVLDQFMIFRQYIQDRELLNMLDRQYQHILNDYNLMVETFSNGKPSTHAPYQMTQTQPVIYGLEPSEPKKPNQSMNDVKDKGISGHMLGLIKSAGSLLTMSAVEVTNPNVRRLMAQCVPCYVEMAYEIFLYQNQRRYYQVPQLSQNDTMQMQKSYVPLTSQPQLPQPNSQTTLH